MPEFELRSIYTGGQKYFRFFKKKQDGGIGFHSSSSTNQSASLSESSVFHSNIFPHLFFPFCYKCNISFRAFLLIYLAFCSHTKQKYLIEHAEFYSWHYFFIINNINNNFSNFSLGFSSILCSSSFICCPSQ